MASVVTIDLRQVARGLDISLPQVQAVVELLDEGNTVPFVTRYRKDQTGGLDEEQIREIQSRLTKMRLLAERKQTILRSIESQGKLTEKLAKQILSATTTKRLEDLYLPYKPRKQTLATLARTRGLEPLAKEILEAAPACADLDARARDFANPDRQVPTGADALLGAGHILAEQFSERADLRQRLREILQRSGKFITSAVAPPEPKPQPSAPAAHAAPAQTAAEAADALPAAQQGTEAAGQKPSPLAEDGPADLSGIASSEPIVAEVLEPASEALPGQVEVGPAEAASDVAAENTAAQPAHPADSAVAGTAQGAALPSAEGPADATQDSAATPDALAVARRQAEPPAEIPTAETAAGPSAEAPAAGPDGAPAGAAPATVSPKERARLARERAKAEKQAKKEFKKKKLEERRIKAFRDYFNYQEEIKKIPPHRMLAINRGERARVLRVKIEYDLEAMYQAVDETLVPPEHPHADYLRGCARDALARLTLPSLEREVRRELTDRAELHAVEVFARNLRNLLLTAPVRDRRVLAVDPGYKSGCKLAALDQFGNLQEHAVIYLIGKPERRAQAMEKAVDLVRRHQLSVVAIGNGTACREVENFFGELLAGELKEAGVSYVIVNEAGASVYSTSQIGREEFPAFDASLRGAISIGRRLQDPLSELVKIDPANIGVGLYQHDIKAKHLRTSLDDVVQSCVNYVGVEVNTASPALLSYVSGLNQLTARRVFEHRQSAGPFRSREQLREVPGFGEATFVQAAGFLKIASGDNPLDATWIHPESYAVAARVLERLGFTPADLSDKEKTASLAQQVAGLALEEVSKELGVGTLTLKDILAQFVRPGRDPREDLPAPVFKHGVLKLEDLAPGMELAGTVLNVVDFGAFVDIGMHDSGLVHVSQLADKFVRDPHEVVAVGDIVRVWVLEVDKQRRRVSLTMIPPGTPRGRRGPRDGKASEGHAERKPAEGRPPAQDRPPRPEGQRRFEGRRPTEGRGPAEGQGRPQGRGRPEGQGRPQGRGRPETGPPRTERRPEGRGPHQGRPRYPSGPRSYERHSNKPIVPITEDMKSGKEPMRTFSDLLQFYEQKKVADTETERSAMAKKRGAPEEGKKPPESGSPATDPSAAADREPSPPSTVEELPPPAAAPEQAPGAPNAPEPEAAAAAQQSAAAEPSASEEPSPRPNAGQDGTG